MVEHKDEDSLQTPLIATTEETVVPDETTKVVAAGVGGAIVGLFILGPLGAALLGFTSAYAAEHKDGVVGDTARAMAKLTLSAREKVVALDSKYKATETATKATETAWTTAKSIDPVGVLDKSKEVTLQTYQSATTYVAEKRLLQRGTEEVVRRVCWLMEKVVGGKDRATINNVSPTASVY
jgi:surface antigen